MPLDIAPLWDYGNPALSEQRFRAAIVQAAPDDAFLLQTQVARTWGLRRDFVKAREILAELEPRLASATAEGQVRWYLESGRTWASPAHPKALRTAESRERARVLFMRAFDLARQARLDNLAVDALHMMVMVDESPGQQLAWNRKAIDYMEASTQPDAKRWAGSLYNNVGYAHHLAGRDDEAIANYRKSLAAFEATGRKEPVRIAYWMIARSLRAQGKLQDALAIQQRLEHEWDADGKPDPYVYEELEQLHRALGNEPEAVRYAAKLKASRG